MGLSQWVQLPPWHVSLNSCPERETFDLPQRENASARSWENIDDPTPVIEDVWYPYAVPSESGQFGRPVDTCITPGQERKGRRGLSVHMQKCKEWRCPCRQQDIANKDRNFI